VLDIVNTSGDKALRVHLDRKFYLVINATTAQAVPAPPGAAVAGYVKDFDIPPNTTQYEVGCTEWFDAIDVKSYLIAYGAVIDSRDFSGAPKPPKPLNPPPAIPPPAVPPIKPIK
jgi:hypothetical protein